MTALPHHPHGAECAEFWESRYRDGDARWDLGRVAPPFANLLKRRPSWLEPGRMLCPGCGGGHDAAAFADHGFDVTAIDFAAPAIEQARRYLNASRTLQVVQHDIFTLPVSWSDSFNYVLEHTCFCAIPTARRRDYAATAYRLLKPGGYLFGLFYRFDPPDEEGPPFQVSRTAIEDVCLPQFKIIHWSTPEQSIDRRQNRERLVVMQKCD